MQIVGYDAGVGELTYDTVDGVAGSPDPASLLLADEGTVVSEALSPGRELGYALGERHCAGSLNGEDHERCESAAAPYCEHHSSTWLCAQCRGDCELPLATCREEHAVYLAAVAPDRFKVGVTRRWRLPARLREQGADRGALIRVVSDGRIARGIEAEIAESLDDRIPVTEKVGSLGKSVLESEWDRLASRYEPIETFDLTYPVTVDGTPVAETVASGRILGTKGRLLVLEHGGVEYAVDLRDLVGHEVVEGTTDRHLQSSLGAF